MSRNWEAREKKLDKRKNGMRVNGRSVFVMEQAAAKRTAREQAIYEAKRRKEKGRE